MNEPKKIDLVERRTAVLRVSVTDLLRAYAKLHGIDISHDADLRVNALSGLATTDGSVDMSGATLLVCWPTAYSTIAPSHPLEGERQSPDLPVELRD